MGKLEILLEITELYLMKSLQFLRQDSTISSFSVQFVL